ncbi:hypothetical protein BSLG_000750 [Batrachochytrium salamandrivorans]|nr:hypothetical protein BSLG_000750 [Batrachochytrium salamandrivorans]
MSLPAEVLLEILLYIQPYIPLKTDYLWAEQTADPRRLYNDSSVCRHLGGSHDTPCKVDSIASLKTSDDIMKNSRDKDRSFLPGGLPLRTGGTNQKCMPSILIFGEVCQQWRRVAMLHPFWTELAWHQLLPRRSFHKPARLISSFLHCMAAEPSRLSRIRHIHLDLLPWNHILDVPDLVSILSRIAHPDRVHTLVLVMRWDACGDPQLIHNITKKFKQCTRLYIQGGQDRLRSGRCGSGMTGGALYGLNSKMLRIMTRHMKFLSHLFLDGFGGNCFSWKSLAGLLRENCGITSLSLGIVRGGIPLNQVAQLLPKLSSLTVQFHIVHFTAPHLLSGADPEASQQYYNYISLSRKEYAPRLYGDLSEFCALKCLTFHNSNGSEEMSLPLIDRLLDTCSDGHIVACDIDNSQQPRQTTRVMFY